MLVPTACINILMLFVVSTCVVAAFNPSKLLELPKTNQYSLTIISPKILEVQHVNSKEPDPATVKTWNFVDQNHKLDLPPKNELMLRVNGQTAEIQALGFRRRPLYAPLKRRDLRIGNSLYLELKHPLSDRAVIELRNASGKFWPATAVLQATNELMRLSPAIHVNQVGYMPAFEKKAMVGFYLGTLGEMKLGQNESLFRLIDVQNRKEVFEGQLKRRKDVGFTFPTYQEVWEADFSEFRTPGEYQVYVPGLGVSLPFFVNDGIAAAFARSYALGLYHQRCGVENTMPFTRFTHRACHTDPAKIPAPTKKFESTQFLLNSAVSEGGKDPNQRAPELKSIQASLYPFRRDGEVEVRGGHHDAGDYSKYTINSAAMVHHLIFAADVFPGVGELDNLGLPESGDGKSDLLQEAKWEADFLAKMQDTDGGFYFLVYPQDRRYEDDVTPDKGDPQVVWPKNTTATAVAVAALAQAASSPLFKRQFPDAAQQYLESAKKGWAFLERAIEKHGWNGSYQRITHYGHEFQHNDELIWAMVEMFLATGDASLEKRFISKFDPEDRETKRWTWWRLYEAYGCAIRSYAFAEPTGRLKGAQLNAEFLAKCRREIMASADDQARFAQESAYGTSFPDPTKRFRTAGWYFSSDRAFDIAVACQLKSSAMAERLAGFRDAIISNMNYEGGCNPVNVAYISGLGWKRQRDIVHQYAQNDRRVLPPSGIPIGNIQAGFQFLHHYQKELGTLTFPPDGAEDRPYPFYDRWGDSFNVSAEFVVVNQARGLATMAYLMAQTSLAKQPYKPVEARIVGLPAKASRGQKIKATVQVPGWDIDQARIVWEAEGQEPVYSRELHLDTKELGVVWVEVEAQWPDGRRAFGVTDLFIED